MLDSWATLNIRSSTGGVYVSLDRVTCVLTALLVCEM